MCSRQDISRDNPDVRAPPPRNGLPARLPSHLARPKARSIDIGDRIQCDPLLFLIGIENRGPIARAEVVALSVEGLGVVDLEKELQEPPIADDFRIEDDLDGFGVIAVIAIGRLAPRRRYSPRGLKSRRDSGGSNPVRPRSSHRQALRVPSKLSRLSSAD